ncbi:DedA family protein [Povalibacter sp.]|uniref:DedA family protein n=1 Tax=Povalibacter sp. TaxID=1962978 RepID=UPI002F3F057B
MDLIHWFIDFVLHLDRHLSELIAHYHYWIYGILFLIIFCETGLVVTPFLPGDSLLFAVGALAAIDSTGTLNAVWLWLLLMVAAILGNEVNFRIGRAIGPRAFSGTIPGLKKDYLLRTQAFYERHGGKTIVLSRFIPIIRTFAPFVAGVGTMQRRRFAAYNFVGAFAWMTLFIWGGFLFGNIPLIKNNFGIVTILIIVVSVLPVMWGMLKPAPQV